MIVVDTNIIAYLFITGQRSEQSERLLAKDPEWAAPTLWRSEFRNVLAGYLRRNHLSFDEVLLIASEAESLLPDREFHLSSSEVFRCVRMSKCSAYDCEFVALAKNLKVPLITTDRRILNDFSDIAVSPDDFLA